jgi:dephospho-CoA kinase
MIILGLTGSIGMGKSTAAGVFRRLGVPVFDADAAVHRLLARGGRAVAEVEAAFPGTRHGDAIDRAALGRTVFGDRAALERLERILHPKVREDRGRFLQAARRRGEPVVVLDIPLLFETGGETACDATCVVTAPAYVQRDRVLRRAGMTEEKLAGILRRQVPDAEKRRRADFVVPTGLGKRHSLRHIAGIVRMLRTDARRPGRSPGSRRERLPLRLPGNPANA